MDSDIDFSSFGLSQSQGVVYHTLLRAGLLTASALAKRIPHVSRPMVYKVLDELESLELIDKHETKGQTTTFQAKHPFLLRNLIAREQAKLAGHKTALDNVLPELVSQFITATSKPGVRILPGREGLLDLYDDILNENQDILLMRSPRDDDVPDLAILVEHQIAAQVKQGIRTRAITPFEELSRQTIKYFDEKRLVDRRIISKEKFDIPAQIIVYSDKVAITAFDEELMTTIIENEAINRTYRIVFEYIWNAATTEHELVMQAITNEESPPDVHMSETDQQS